MTKPKQLKRLKATNMYIKLEALEALHSIREQGESLSHLVMRLVAEHKAKNNRRLAKA